MPLLGKAPRSLGAVGWDIVEQDDGYWCVIEGYDALRPFLMSIVSDVDLWMFLSSTGGLTAGRRSAENALFPYVTDDRIYDAFRHTGPLTILQVPELWEPFSDRFEGLYRLRRTLSKHMLGHKVRFEEVNVDLGLQFSYTWQPSDEFGWVRTAELTNVGGQSKSVRVLDGLRNILPFGASLLLQNERSTLLDAYKRNEFFAGVGLYSVSSRVVDRPEPAESLQCTTVWHTESQTRIYSENYGQGAVLLSERQVGSFRRGKEVVSEHDVRAERGAFLVIRTLDLAPGEAVTWIMAANLEQDYAAVVRLAALKTYAPQECFDQVRRSLKKGTKNLGRIIGLADGFQRSQHFAGDLRHTANTLFNVMRGGTCADQYHVQRSDVAAFVQARNTHVATALENALPARMTLQQLLEVSQTLSPQCKRICRQYLPLKFSRRHGDPSRPWNRFSIKVRNADGSERLDYEGNWRDIFQNWEALAHSYPALLPGMIATFVDASTADGYNPYRISREGIDWEVPDPKDPWAHIGYWGDHQTVYLLRLLLLGKEHFPELLPSLLGDRSFAYANVPYRIKPYEAIVADPYDTIIFDEALADRIAERVRAIGSDGKLLWDGSGQVLLVTFLEKLLVSLLARLSNFVPGAGIWMNTQRPEWNDANNALVGRGISVVTLCYLRSFLAFCRDLFGSVDQGVPTAVSEEVITWMLRLREAIAYDLSGRTLMDAVGAAASDYRQGLYEHGLSGTTRPIHLSDVAAFVRLVLPHVDAAIRANRRQDGLYHTYNLLPKHAGDVLNPERLPLTLEGQVAALSSGRVGVEEAVQMLRTLRKSVLWREDQESYLLYPDRDLPPFTEKCAVAAAQVERSALLKRLVDAGDFSIVGRAIDGRYYFHGGLVNRNSVAEALDRIAQRVEYRDAASQDRNVIQDIFEQSFHHRAFTGRSGTFFKYEGLGSIYWHIVSKLLLAVQEVYFRGVDEVGESAMLEELARLYYGLRAGLGDHKSPEEYGAFPTDPYSHTPAHMGAQQPGMTGQVKEDIIGRWNELGVRVRSGRLSFTGALLRRREFLREPARFTYYNTDSKRCEIRLPAGAIGFTYAQVPVIYRLDERPRLRVCYRSGSKRDCSELSLSAKDSRAVFHRTGEVAQIHVHLEPRYR